MGFIWLYTDEKGKSSDGALKRDSMEKQNQELLMGKYRLLMSWDSIATENKTIKNQKQKVKIIYREIDNIINNIPIVELDSSLSSDGFNEVFPCE